MLSTIMRVQVINPACGGGVEPRQYGTLLMHVWLAVWRARLGMSDGKGIYLD